MADPSLIAEARRACTNPHEFTKSRRIWLLGRMLEELEALQPEVFAERRPATDELPLMCVIATARQILQQMEPNNDRHFVHFVRHLTVVLKVGDLTMRKRQTVTRRLH